MRSYAASAARGSAPAPLARGGAGDCVLWHLLQVAYGDDGAARSAMLSAMEPRSASGDADDFGAAFALLRVLQRLARRAALPEGAEDRVCEGLVAQLCGAGEWQWAVYVRLTQWAEAPRGAEMRRRAVEEVLQRFGWREGPDEEARRAFVVERLGVPRRWAAAAVAHRLYAAGDFARAASLLVEVGEWDGVARICADKLAPRMVLRGGQQAERIRGLLSMVRNGLGDDMPGGHYLRLLDLLEAVPPALEEASGAAPAEEDAMDTGDALRQRLEALVADARALRAELDAMAEHKGRAPPADGTARGWEADAEGDAAAACHSHMRSAAAAIDEVVCRGLGMVL